MIDFADRPAPVPRVATAGRGARTEHWMRRLRSGLRARLTPGRLLLAALLVGGLLALSALLEDDEPGAPEDHAAALVPAEAVAYVHANVGRESSQWERAQSLLERFPALVQLADPPAEDAHAPWRSARPGARGPAMGGRRGGAGAGSRQRRPGPLADPAGGLRSASWRVPSWRDPWAGSAPASTAGSRFAPTARRRPPSCAASSPSGSRRVLRSGIDAALRPARSLACDPIFRRARADIPDRDRVLFGYASRRGLRAVLERRPGLAGRLATLADDPAAERRGRGAAGGEGRRQDLHVQRARAARTSTPATCRGWSTSSRATPSPSSACEAPPTCWRASAPSPAARSPSTSGCATCAPRLPMRAAYGS